MAKRRRCQRPEAGLTFEQRRRIRRRQAAGWSIARLAAKYDISKAAIRRVLGPKIRRGRPPVQLHHHAVAQDVKDYNQGMSLAKLAKRRGTTAPTMARRLREAGVEIRPRGWKRKPPPPPSIKRDPFDPFAGL